MKRTIKSMSLILAVIITLGAVTLTACGEKETEKGEVTIRYLNFKPEIADGYKQLADAYYKESGVKVIVDTAANNQYESTLTAKMSTKEAPTLFQINGPKGYANWKSYCKDLKDTKIYSALNDKSLAITGSDGGVYGIPYVVEGYGIIYNKEITDKYFALKNKKTDFNSMDEVNSFKKLKSLTEDMTANKSALGIKGVFASTSMKSGEDWRWQTHLANLPVYYEFKSEDVDLSSDETDEIDFTYSENFKNIFNLYLDNSTVPRTAVATKTVTDSMSEFSLGQCAMVQNGNWAWSQIKDVAGNKVKEENVKFLPIYIGVDGEEKQGICIGTENYYAINKNSSDAEIKAAQDFIYWLFTSDTGKKYVVEKFDFIAPFNTFSESERPSDPLAREVVRYMERDDLEVVPWQFTLFPSAKFKEDFGASLLKYAQGNKTFDKVKSDMTASWKKESESAE